MPFESKAQQRYMFAQHPRIAKRWAKETPDMKNLPEKAMDKKGSFFADRHQPKAGRFFRDLPGREDGDFAKQSMLGGSQPINIGATGAPMGGQGYRGAGMGDLYGTGKPKKKAPTPEKIASRSPSDWDADASAPVGFHRPTRTQPEAQEAGGARFHSSKHSQGTGDGIRHGVVEGGRFATRSGRTMMGKQAADVPDFGRHIGQAGSSIGRAKDRMLKGTDEALQSVSSNPWASLAAAGGLGLLGYGLLRRGGRSLAKAVKGIKKPPVPATPPKPAPLSARMKKALEALQGKN